MPQSPAFPFYAKDYYTGTSDLSSTEVGVYSRGLAWSWDNGPLPLDDDRRSRALMSPPKEFAKVWPAIAHLWEQTPAGYTNKRLEAERQKQADYRKLQAEKGSKGGRPKKHGGPHS